MAIVAVYTSENCPGMPEGAIGYVHDDDLAPDQAAQKARAYAVAARIHWRRVREEMARQELKAGMGGGAP